MPLITAKNLQCVRGDRTLFENLSFKLDAGTCLHVRGSNGSGKTSLLRILCGLLTPSAGNLANNSDDLTSENNDLDSSVMAYLGHKNGLKDELTAIENLRFYQGLNGQGSTSQDSDRDATEAKLDTVLLQVGLLKVADLASGKLSFGQKRRLAFSRLLLNQKPIWILDEPFTGIDQPGRDLLEGCCVDHLKTRGAIILTHHGNLDDSVLADFVRVIEL